MRLLICVLVCLWASICHARIYPLHLLHDGQERATATATHIGDGVLLTCRHCFEPIDGITEFEVEIGEHPARLLHVSEDSDLATIYCEGLKGERGYVVSPDGHDVPVGSEVTVWGYAMEGGQLVTKSATDTVRRYYTCDGVYQSDATEVECNITVHQGMSGGALVDEHGYLIGIISGNVIDGSREYCCCTCTTSFWRVVYRVPAYHPWRPVLHVWSSNNCGPCHQFWEDFVSDPQFRAALEANFRFPRNANGTVNQQFFNVDLKPGMARSWGIETVPCFGLNPASRVTGYGPADNDRNCPAQWRGLDRKAYLLARLGILVSAFAPDDQQPTNPQPGAVEPEPTPAQPVHSTGPGCNCSERLQSIEARLNSLAATVAAWEGLPGPPGPTGPAGPPGPPGADGEPRTITVIIQDDEGNRLAAPVEVPPTANTVRIPIERFERE